MAQAGRVSVTQFLDLLKAYEHEDDANVVGAIFSHLSALKKLHGSEVGLRHSSGDYLLCSLL